MVYIVLTRTSILYWPFKLLYYVRGSSVTWSWACCPHFLGHKFRRPGEQSWLSAYKAQCSLYMLHSPSFLSPLGNDKSFLWLLKYGHNIDGKHELISAKSSSLCIDPFVLVEWPGRRCFWKTSRHYRQNPSSVEEELIVRSL